MLRGAHVGSLFLLFTLSIPSRLSASAQDAATVFERFVPAVAKLEVIEPYSRAPRSVGTAFFVDGYGDGVLVTNYHVVRDAIFDGDKGLRLHLAGGVVTENVEIRTADAAHDLAILHTTAPAPGALELQVRAPPLGADLFSIGHPADLATSVVQGIYNGRVGHSVSPRYHFTGSVNPGMSGGPTVTADGRVIGINVSTAGNQLSFVIPAVLADALLLEARIYDATPGETVEQRLSRRLEIFQRNFFGAFLRADLPTIELGRATVPVGPEDSFDCSAETYDIEDQKYDRVTYRCTTFDSVTWPDGEWRPFISIEHVYLASDRLNRFQFTSLYSDFFTVVNLWEVPESDETGDWSCRRGNVANEAGAVLRVSFCARAHEELVGLYDAFIRTALLGGDHTAGVVGTFRVNGVTFQNAARLSRKAMEGFSWND